MNDKSNTSSVEPSGGSQFLRSPINRALVSFAVTIVMVLTARFVGPGVPKPAFDPYAVFFVIFWTAHGYFRAYVPLDQPRPAQPVSDALTSAVGAGLLIGVTFGTLFYLGAFSSISPSFPFFMSVYLAVSSGLMRYRRRRGHMDNGWMSIIPQLVGWAVAFGVAFLARI